MNAHLFICFSIFDFKTLKDKEIKNNVRNNFLYKTHLLFDEYLKNSNSLGHFRQKIISSSNNKSLFYTGVEDEAKEFANNSLHKVESLINENFLRDSLLKKTKIIKMKIGKDKKKSLLCTLIILNDNNFQNIHEEKEIKETFILFPLKYDDFHK